MMMFLFFVGLDVVGLFGDDDGVAGVAGVGCGVVMLLLLLLCCVFVAAALSVQCVGWYCSCCLCWCC